MKNTLLGVLILSFISSCSVDNISQQASNPINVVHESFVGGSGSSGQLQSNASETR